MHDHRQAGAALERLLDIIAELRAENGCPWDQKQTPETLKKYLLEETAELAEAIDSGDADHIREEIGDLFFILTMYTTMYREKDIFSTADSLHDIAEKMIRRHPHVFADLATGNEQELRAQWESIKANEKAAKSA